MRMIGKYLHRFSAALGSDVSRSVKTRIDTTKVQLF